MVMVNYALVRSLLFRLAVFISFMVLRCIYVCRERYSYFIALVNEVNFLSARLECAWSFLSAEVKIARAVDKIAECAHTRVLVNFLSKYFAD